MRALKSLSAQEFDDLPGFEGIDDEDATEALRQAVILGLGAIAVMGGVLGVRKSLKHP
mgnify:CR=1 FL=1